MPDFIYTMKKLGKVYPPDFVVFQDIYLSFYYGAKIGVIGSNGSGKSSLLRIMAGLDPNFLGEARLSSGFTVGFLPQEPELDKSKTVLGNVEEGVAPTRALLTKFDEINAKFGEDMSPEAMEKLLEEQARVQDAIDAAGAWDLDSKLEHAMDALRLPPPDADVSKLSGGEIVERGTHAELIAKNGRYKQLYDKQYNFERDRFVNPGEELLENV